MPNNVSFWDAFYKNNNDKIPNYDLWLGKYKNLLDLSKNETIIDLGCGSGGNTLYLKNNGYNVIACDFSKEALNLVDKFIPNVKTLNVDITKKLPFITESTMIVIADLSLHYFDVIKTEEILGEIFRVLKKGGYLICRVNSINDINYGALDGIEIEKNYYATIDGYKRFFDLEDIQKFFKKYAIDYCEESSVDKYGVVKKAWEIVAHKYRQFFVM
ncbi:class I SAM-dependent methyltransferase [Clostridium butyricum]|uniref:class I SAM-dependent methyltransferase n=1 Tax=Clostridium butyricum TaxID=1492 RepID=UPI002910601D|nr:class I SAM-dependent methyltransferase [Clostridium butyricum]MDU3594508.1 class I SAM-dependent methyltransferase [Clostridium butyricum]